MLKKKIILLIVLLLTTVISSSIFFNFDNVIIIKDTDLYQEFYPFESSLSDYDEDFSTSNLSSRWTFYNEISSKWSLTARAGYMRIIPESYVDSGNNLTAGYWGNLLLQDAPQGDFEITTELEFSPNSNAAHAGLILYISNTSYICFETVYNTALDPSGRILHTESDSPNGYSAANVQYEVNALTHIFLKLQKFGDTVRFFYSADGNTWLEFTNGVQWSPAAGDLKVGLRVWNGNSGPHVPADFNYFKICKLECYEEYFSTSDLGSGWTFYNEISSKWSLTAHPGYMRIIPESYIDSGNNLTAGYWGNLLLRDAPKEDFEITTELEFSPNSNAAHAGLILYISNTSYICFETAYNTALDPSGRILHTESDSLNGYSAANVQYEANALTHIFLKLQKFGDTIRFFYSADGNTWIEFTTGVQWSPAAGSLKVGLRVWNGNSGPHLPADFNFFKICKLECYKEDFSTSYLSSGWTFYNEIPSKWSLTARPGYMRIIPESYVDSSNNLTAGYWGNLLLQDAPQGDFEITTELEFSPNSNAAHAGLILYISNTSYICFETAYNTALDPSGRILHTESDSLNGYSAANVQYEANALTHIFLKLQKFGDTIRFFYSADGNIWSEFTTGMQWSPAAGSLKVGLRVWNGNSGPHVPADFNYFKICKLECYEEHFSTSDLGSGWTFYNEISSKWSLTARPGYMRIIPESYIDSGNNLTAGYWGNLLLRDAPQGDFEITTELEFSPNSNAAHAGLILYVSNTSYICFETAYNTALDPSGRILHTESDSLNGYSAANVQYEVNALTHIFLKLQKFGETVRFFYSADGNTWSEFTTGVQWNPTAGDLKVGLRVWNGNSGPHVPADFNYFKICTFPLPPPCYFPINWSIFDGLYLNYTFYHPAYGFVDSDFLYTQLSEYIYGVRWDTMGYIGLWDVDVRTRLMDNINSVAYTFGSGNHTPIWIHTNINLGTIIPIGIAIENDHLFQVIGETIYKIPGHGTVEVWNTIDLTQPGGIAYYEKNTGLLVYGNFYYYSGSINYTFFIKDTNAVFDYIIGPGTFNLSSNAESPDTDGNFNLIWTSSAGADNYSIYLYDNYITEINDSLILLANQNGTSPFTISGLTDGIYYFIVVAYNEIGHTQSNCISIIVQLSEHSPGSFLLSSNAESPDTDGNFNLIWTSSAGADNYSIYIYDSYISKINASLTLMADQNGISPFTVSGLTDGTYYFIVVAHNEYGDTLSNCIIVTVSIAEDVTDIPGYHLLYLGITIFLISIVLIQFIKNRIK